MTATTSSATGRLEPLDGLGLRDGRRLAVDERQPVRADRRDRALGADADGARATASIPPIAAEAEHCDAAASRRGAHATPGSTTRFTYCVSE